MKKLSLMLVFVMLLVAMLALGVFAADTNIAKNGNVKKSSGNWVVNAGMICDNNHNTGVSGDYNAHSSAFTFQYDREHYFGKAVLVVNSSGTLKDSWTSHETVTNYNYKIQISMYDSNNNRVFFHEDWTGNKTQIVLNPYVNASKVVVEYWCEYDTTCGLWEVELYEHTCEYTELSSSENDKAVTCLTDGIRTLACYGGDSTKTEVIPAPGRHTYDNGEVTTEPSYTAPGVKTFTCTKCEELGCTECEGYQYTEEIPMLGHNWDNGTVTNPTCLNRGYTTYKCTDEGCEEIKIDDYVDPIGHRYNEGEVTTKPTTTSEGVKTFTCQNDANHVYTENVDMIPWNAHEFTITNENVYSIVETLVGDAVTKNGGSAFFDGSTKDKYWAILDEKIKDGVAYNNSVTITLDKEYYTSANVVMYAWSNHNSIKIEFFDETGNRTFLYEDSRFSTNTDNVSDPVELPNSVGLKVKDIVVTYVSSKWKGEGIKVYELVMKAHQHINDGTKIDYVAPTCTEKGSYYEYCEDCGVSNIRVEEPALGHTELTPATCAVAAVCETCGEYYGEKLPHTLGTAATCKDLAVCAVCEQTYGEYAAHTGGTATCSEQAICSECNQPYGEFADHVWGEFACSMGNCVNCGAKNDGVSAEPHTYGWKIPVKNEAGEIVKYIHGCSVCLLEAKEDKDEANKGLGYSTTLGEGLKIYYVSSFAEFNTAIGKADAAVVRVISDNVDVTSAYTIQKDVIIDFGGHTVIGSAQYTPLQIRRATKLVNGTFYSTSNQTAIKLWNVGSVEDLNIIVASIKGKNCGAITIMSPKYGEPSYVGAIRNVFIDSARQEDGTYYDDKGLYNHGIETQDASTVIGEMTNVKVYSKGQGMTTAAKIGTMTDCVFSGDIVGIAFVQLNGTFKLVKSEVYGGSLAVQINGVSETDAKFDIGPDSAFYTGGILYYVSDEITYDYDLTLLKSAVAAVDGKLYDKFEDALNAIKTSTEDVVSFSLMADMEITSAIVIDRKVNFSLGGGTFYYTKYGYNTRYEVKSAGYTISCPTDEVGDGIFHVVKNGELTITGVGVINSVGNNKYNIAIWADGGKVVIDDEAGLITNVGATGADPEHFDLIYVKNGGIVEINGGTFKAQTPKWTLNLNDSNGGTIVVNGGVFYGYDPSKSDTEPNGPVSFVSDAIKCIYINEDGAYALASKHTYEHDDNYVTSGCTETDTAPTCTEDGYRTHTCKCGEFRIQQGGAAKGHKAAAAVQENINDATCSAAGSYDSVVYCSVCNAEISRETLTIDALPHTEAIDQAIAPTCTETGLTEGKHCSVCGETLVAQTEVKMLDHNYVPVENEDGSITYTCQNGCNDSYVINNALVNGEYYLGTDLVVFNNGVLSAMGGEFTYTYNVTTGMITTDDEGLFFQMIEGTIHYRGRLPLHTHAVDVLTTKVTNPTCTDKGYTTYICTTCGPLYDGNYVDATGHSYGSMKIEQPTCTEDGYLQITCRTCEKTFVSPSPETDAYIDSQPPFITITIKPATGHTAAEAVQENVQNATCTAAGSYESVVYCSVCEAELSRKTETVNAIGHKWTDATCTAPKTCSVCKATEGEALGHNYGTGVVNANSVIFTCTACGTTKEIAHSKANLGETQLGYDDGAVDAVYYYIEISEAGTVTIKVDEYAGIKLGVNPEALSAQEFMTGENAYTFEMTEAGRLFIVFSLNVYEYDLPESFETSFEAAPICQHTNTEIIPAVLPLPSNNHTGKTAGLYCLDCETVVKEQVEFTVEKLAADHAFRFRAASIVLDENISVNYKPAKLDGYNNVYVVFVFEGKEYVLDEYLRIEQATSGLRYVFNFDATRPQLMASNIAAYVYAETENGYVMNCKEEYSLLEYCVTQLKGNGKDAYKAIISNALVLGAETQKIMGVNTNALVTDLAIAQGCTLNPTTFTEVRAEQNVQAIVGDRTGGTDWKAGTFRLGSSTEMVLKFETDSIENLRVKITVGGKDTYIDITEETERDGKRYVIVVDFITALQFNEKVVATFERDGKQIGSTAEYSINSYIYKNYNKENNEQEALIKALYVYGQSIYDYSRGTNNYQ